MVLLGFGEPSRVLESLKRNLRFSMEFCVVLEDTLIKF